MNHLSVISNFLTIHLYFMTFGRKTSIQVENVV